MPNVANLPALRATQTPPPQARALTAPAPSSGPIPGVVRVVGMAILACLQFSTVVHAARQIDNVWNWLQVGRVDATSNAAKMVECEPVRYWPAKELVYEAVRGHQVPFWHHSVAPAIALAGYSSHPNPASTFSNDVDLVGNARDKRKMRFSHVTPFQSHRSGPRSVPPLLRPVLFNYKPSFTYCHSKNKRK